MHEECRLFWISSLIILQTNIHGLLNLAHQKIIRIGIIIYGMQVKMGKSRTIGNPYLVDLLGNMMKKQTNIICMFFQRNNTIQIGKIKNYDIDCMYCSIGATIS